uniref:N/A n=1 Tax=Ganoderma boninense TaxID=34458 RepID=A0A5K1JZ17_9APHY|nr:N/A [Ganoderma boninense]
MFTSISPPRAERTATIHLLCGSDVESFIKSVYANEVDIPSIQGFRISSGSITQSIGDVFAGLIVKHLGVLKIRHLEIHHAEEFLGSSSSHRLVHAFAMCSTITHLILDEVGDRARDLLVKSRFSLVSENLAMPDLDDEPGESDSESEQDPSSEFDSDSPRSNRQRDAEHHARHNPIVLLRNSRATLESLTTTSCRTALALGPTAKATTKDLSFKHVYPRLTALALHQCADVPPTFRLVSAFPHLRTLHASFALDAIMDAGEAAGGFRARRRANEGKQKVFGTWRALEACHAPLLEHYLLGLACRVARLHVQGDHMDAGMLGEVLRRTAPACVRLQGFDADVFGPQAGLADALAQLADDVVGGLAELDVALDVGSTLPADHIDVEQMLGNLADALQPLRIHTFRLSLAVCIHGSPRPPLDAVPLCAQERYLEILDLDALATRIRTSVPSLQTVTIRLSGHSTRPLATAVHEVGRDHAVPMVCD